MRATEVLKVIKTRQKIKWAFSPFWLLFSIVFMFVLFLFEAFKIAKDFYNEVGGVKGFCEMATKYKYKRSCKECGERIYPISEEEVNDLLERLGDIELCLCTKCSKNTSIKRFLK